MCNAWNHRPGCSCGFGGEGHLGGGTGFSYSDILNIYHDGLVSSGLIINKQVYESYVNPNAICPVCGASVYFYQSPDGGRVFFDELGPPWPKHSCTDNGELPKRTTITTWTSPKWKEFGWLPLDIHEPEQVNGYFLLSGFIINQNKKEEIQDYLLMLDHDFKNSDLKFFRQIDTNSFEVMFLNLKNGRTGKIIGHTRRGSLSKSLAINIPIRTGDEILAEYRGIDLGFKIQVHPIDRKTNLKCVIDKRDLKPETRKKTNIIPHIKFTLITRVTDVKRGEITMIEI